MKTQRERAAERRVARLADVQDQIAAGTLVIRSMTTQERADYPAQPRPERGKGSRPRYR